MFTKPVVLLVSDLTASAADLFTMMAKELPNFTILGDNTQGIFSDTYGFSLPNKWNGTLSHQQYFSADMKNYEVIGIEPHIRLLNQPVDIESGVDPLIIKAIDILDNKITTNKG